MEQTEEDRLRSKYIESLEFDSEEQKNNVKCQGCGGLCPVVKQNELNRLTCSEPRMKRILYLQTVIKQAEKHHIAAATAGGCIDGSAAAKMIRRRN